MPKFLENKLKAEYPNNPRAVYGTLNEIGAMVGNKETAKGRKMQAKHDLDSGHPHKNLGKYLHPKKSRG
jgi:hypothetical protein